MFYMFMIGNLYSCKINRMIKRLNQFLVSLPPVHFYFLIFFGMTFITMSLNSDIRYDKLVHDKMRKNYIYNFISAFMLEKNDENLYHCLCVSFNLWDSVLCNLLWEIFPLSYSLHDFCPFQFNVKFCTLTLQGTVKLFNFLFFFIIVRNSEILYHLYLKILHALI